MIRHSSPFTGSSETHPSPSSIKVEPLALASHHAHQASARSTRLQILVFHRRVRRREVHNHNDNRNLLNGRMRHFHKQISNQLHPSGEESHDPQERGAFPARSDSASQGHQHSGSGTEDAQMGGIPCRAVQRNSAVYWCIHFSCSEAFHAGPYRGTPDRLAMIAWTGCLVDGNKSKHLHTHKRHTHSKHACQYEVAPKIRMLWWHQPMCVPCLHESQHAMPPCEQFGGGVVLQLPIDTITLCMCTIISSSFFAHFEEEEAAGHDSRCFFIQPCAREDKQPTEDMWVGRNDSRENYAAPTHFSQTSKTSKATLGREVKDMGVGPSFWGHCWGSFGLQEVHGTQAS